MLFVELALTTVVVHCVAEYRGAAPYNRALPLLQTCAPCPRTRTPTLTYGQQKIVCRFVQRRTIHLNQCKYILCSSCAIPTETLHCQGEDRISRVAEVTPCHHELVFDMKDLCKHHTFREHRGAHATLAMMVLGPR